MKLRVAKGILPKTDKQRRTLDHELRRAGKVRRNFSKAQLSELRKRGYKVG